MQDLSSAALDNLYSNLILRDILSFIIPGAIVFFSVFKLSSVNIDTLDAFSLLKTSEILLIVILLGIFYIVGFLVQIIRGIIGRLWLFQFPARWINKKLNPESETRAEYEKLINMHKSAGQFPEKSSQILERFTAFFQCCGNCCIAFSLAWVVFSSDSPLSFVLISLCIILSYIGYVIHKERREIWISAILNENDRLKQLFFELKDERKMIDIQIDLVETMRTPNFQGLNFFGLLKLLRYNPVFFKLLSRYDDNTIRFVLLHEAGHIESGSLYRIENILAVMVFLIFLVGIFITIILQGFIQLIVLMIFMIILVAMVCLIIKKSLKSMKNDEFVADEHAFKKMQENYEIGDPCVFIDNVFNAMDSIVKEPIYKEISNDAIGGGRIKELLMKYSGLDEGYHPTNPDRANRLKEIAKCE